MTNEMLVKAIRAGDGNKRDLLETLYNQNKGIITSMACRYKRGSLEADDLMQEAYFILLDATETYDESKGKFITWLSHNLQCKFLRCIDNDSTAVRLPVYKRDQVRVYRNERERFYKVHGVEPTDLDMCGIMGLSRAEVTEIKALAMSGTELSLDAPMNDTVGGETTSFIDMIPDNTDAIGAAEDRLAADEIAVRLWQVVDDLGGAEGRIIKEYYHDGRVLADIGKDMGISAQRVCDRKENGLNMLRKGKQQSTLRSWLETYSAGLFGVGLSIFRYTGTSSTERAALHLQ